MAYPVFAVANEFINRNVPNLTPMKLQKLIYFANVLYIKETKGRDCIVDEVFMRWMYGPVIPSLYHQLRRYDKPYAQIIPLPLRWVELNTNNEDFRSSTPTIPPGDDTLSCITSVIENYGQFLGPQLAKMTMNDNVWFGKNGERQGDGSVITKRDIIKAHLGR